MAQTGFDLAGNLSVVKLLRSYGGKALPVGFVADQLGITETVANERITTLANDDVVKIDGGSVSLKS